MENFYIYPALLFPAIPLMMTNFTNRYNSCAALTRKIHDEIINKKIDTNSQTGQRYLAQLQTLALRIKLIKTTQILSGFSFLFNLVSVPSHYLQFNLLAFTSFGVGVLLLGIAIMLFVYEVSISAKALELHLGDLKEFEKF
ncbi:MAG: DUF2721 domain-containing protein [Pelagibacterales bacterium]|nr:DUF2721 domain-containing protein [Pelagibacterales bacterium]